MTMICQNSRKKHELKSFNPVSTRGVTMVTVVLPPRQRNLDVGEGLLDEKRRLLEILVSVNVCMSM